MKYRIHIVFLLLVICGGATVWADGNAVLLAPRAFSEYFTDNLRQDTRESGLDQTCAELGCARSHGWGKGYVTHARVGFAVREGNYNRMPQAKPPAPAPLPPSIKPTRVVAGYFRTNSNSSDPQAPQDMIALTASSGGCHLHYMLNKGPDDTGANHLGWDVGVLAPGNTWTTGHFVSGQGGSDNWWRDSDGVTGSGNGINDADADCQADEDNALSGDSKYATALFAGDFDSDGWTDVLYLRAAEKNNEGDLDIAYVFWNTGSLNVQGVPSFTRTKLGNGTSLFAKGISWHISSDIGEVADLSGDGKEDLVLASSKGSVHKIFLFRQKASANRSDPFLTGELIIQDGSIRDASDESNDAGTNNGCLASDGPGRGITALAVDDFNADGEKDIVYASMSQKHIRYYYNTGNNQFTSTSITYVPGGVTSIHAGNWNLEGGVDLLVTRSSLGCNGRNA